MNAVEHCVTYDPEKITVGQMIEAICTLGTRHWYDRDLVRDEHCLPGDPQPNPAE